MMYEIPYDLDAVVSSEDAFSAAPPEFMCGKKGGREGRRKEGDKGELVEGKRRARQGARSSMFFHHTYTNI